ncbi:MAG: hypothetical protein QOH36_1339 [Actinomycetota bacterium]|jgi:hypothetical protein|nr:hypothetical protein [Actinomycetota bacterium]MEA2973403.1 hypothetical protein [Actinomycetota bacterium]
MATFIDHVHCGECDAGLTLEAVSVVLQRYRRQPWLRHFWVHCELCASHKLYWPTARQLRLAEQLRCRTVTEEAAPADVSASYVKATGGLPVTMGRGAPVKIPYQELGFLLGMLAATCGPAPVKAPARSYLPAHWSN